MANNKTVEVSLEQQGKKPAVSNNVPVLPSGKEFPKSDVPNKALWLELGYTEDDLLYCKMYPHDTGRSPREGHPRINGVKLPSSCFTKEEWQRYYDATGKSGGSSKKEQDAIRIDMALKTLEAAEWNEAVLALYQNMPEIANSSEFQKAYNAHLLEIIKTLQKKK